MLSHGEESVQKFIEHLNNFHPDLRFTSEISVYQLNFLDVIVKLQKNEFLPDLYCNMIERKLIVISIFIMIPVIQNT